MRFEWDPQKAVVNAKEHGITFQAASAIFTSGVPVLEVYDLEHSEVEDRFKSLGPIESGLILVVWTERDDDVIRVISAWPATKTEQQLYEDFLEDYDG